jgi:hypothetical protein
MDEQAAATVELPFQLAGCALQLAQGACGVDDLPIVHRSINAALGPTRQNP